MAPMGTNKDEWIAAIASYVRNAFGNVGTFVSPADVARVRAATADRKTFWKVDELVASLPAPLDVLPTWKASASHNPGTALGALELRVVDDRRAAASRACGSKSSCRSRRPSPSCSSIRRAAGSRAVDAADEATWRLRRATPPPAPLVPPGPYPRGYKVEVSTNGTTWTAVAEGQGTPGSTTITFAPIRSEVRPDHADGHGRGCAAVVDATAAFVPAGSEEVAEWRAEMRSFG